MRPHPIFNTELKNSVLQPFSGDALTPFDNSMEPGSPGSLGSSLLGTVVASGTDFQTVGHFAVGKRRDSSDLIVRVVVFSGGIRLDGIVEDRRYLQELLVRMPVGLVHLHCVQIDV